MTIFLTSLVKFYKKGIFGIKIPTKLENTNNFFDNLKASLKGSNRLVVVANDSEAHLENDKRAKIMKKSFAKSGIKFKETIVLDSRKQDKAKEIISGADLVILCGGKCLRELKFFEKINLAEIFSTFKGVIIGISAGSMNLGKIVANFPEDDMDKDEPRWLEGLGLYNGILIPHYDGIFYQFELEFDVVQEYILPMSEWHDFVAIPNSSYILINENGEKMFGDAFKISKRITTKINWFIVDIV